MVCIHVERLYIIYIHDRSIDTKEPLHRFFKYQMFEKKIITKKLNYSIRIGNIKSLLPIVYNLCTVFKIKDIVYVLARPSYVG